MKVRSMVGLMPLFAVETLEPECLANMPVFKRRMEWFLEYRPDMANLVSRWTVPGVGERRLLSLLRGHRMKALLKRMLAPQNFFPTTACARSPGITPIILSSYGFHKQGRC